MATTTTSTTTKRERPSLAPIITRLRYPLAPLHPLPNGHPHPSFPPTLLHYHLLTEDQLDSIATYYHQKQSSSPGAGPSIWQYGYPACMNWDNDFIAHIGETQGMEERIRVKRRKVGKFIGFRGCETPVEEAMEKERWMRKRDDMKLKSEDVAFYGRRGFRRW